MRVTWKHSAARGERGMREKRLAVFAVVAVLICAAVLPRPALSAEGNIIAYPSTSAPVLLRPGDYFEAGLECGSAARITRVSLRPGAGTGAQPVLVSKAFDCREHKRLTLAAPVDAPVGLYDFCVERKKGEGAETVCRGHAVSVVQEFKPAFRFVVLTDFHVGDERGGKNNPGIPLQELRAKAMAAVNAARPDFVLLTGDLVYYPTTYEADYAQALREVLDGLKVPAFIVPGNHDLYAMMGLGIDGRTFWAEAFGPRRSAFTYGPFRFIGFNTYNWPPAYSDRLDAALIDAVGSRSLGIMGRGEFEWVKQQLEEARGMNLRPVLFAHHDPMNMSAFAGDDKFPVIQRDEFAKFVRAQGVEYYFFGHTHKNYTREDGDTLYISTGTASSSYLPGEAWSIRIVDVDAAGNLTMRPFVVWTPLVSAGQ